MISRPPTLKDVFLSEFNFGYVWRYTPDASAPGGYAEAWRTQLPGRGIGMTDDGKWLYCATWSSDIIVRVNPNNGVIDTAWNLDMNALGCLGGSMESLSVRTKNGHKTLIVGYADPFLFEGTGIRHHWAEVDLTTRTLIRSNVNTLAHRGCDWVWCINADEFVTGTEATYFVKIDIETGECVQYLPAVGVQVPSYSYSIEVRAGRFVAVVGNDGPLQVGTVDANGHNPVIQQSVQIHPFAGGTYFASSLESDGKHLWMSSYTGDMPDDAESYATPVWRVETDTGVGHSAPLFFIPGSWNINGVYCPSFGRESTLKSGPQATGARLDGSNDPKRRMAVRS